MDSSLESCKYDKLLTHFINQTYFVYNLIDKEQISVNFFAKPLLPISLFNDDFGSNKSSFQSNTKFNLLPDVTQKLET